MPKVLNHPQGPNRAITDSLKMTMGVGIGSRIPKRERLHRGLSKQSKSYDKT